MRRGNHFRLDNHENYEEVPVLVNTLNKLATRINTLNHRLEKRKIWLCAHPCCQKHITRTRGSVNCINIQDLADDCEPCAMKSTNHGSHEINKGAMDIHMIDANMHRQPPETKCNSEMQESYHFLPNEQPYGLKEQKVHISFIDTLAGQPHNNDTNQPAMTIKVDNDPKQPDFRGVQNKRCSSDEGNSSVQFVRIDSSGLKSLKTDPKEDNRQKTIKEDLKNNTNSAQLNVTNNKDANPKREPNLKKYEDVQSKGNIKHANRQKNEVTPSSNIVKTDDKLKSRSDFVTMERSADKNRNKDINGTISAPSVFHTAKALTRSKVPFMVQTHLPKEYWDSVFNETFDKAKEIRRSRSIGFDTIICLDTSASVAEYWEDIHDFLRNLINEIETSQPMERGFMEHIALVTFGHETCALQHFTTNYKEVLAKIHLIYPEGSTPLFWAVDLCQAILAGSAMAPELRDFRFAPRLLLITDGRPTYRFMTGGLDESVKYDEDKEKADVATRLISISMRIPLLRIFPVAVGNNCDMDFLTAIAKSCGGKVMTLSDWSPVAQYWKKMDLASKYLGLASVSQDLLAKVLRESSGLPQEDVELIATETKDQLEYQNDEGTTTDEEEVEGSYQLPPVGSRVRRGPDWSRCDEDNNGPGTIISYSKGKVFAGWVIVEWDKEKKYSRWRFRYRYGAENAHDVKVQTREGPRVMEHSLIMTIGCEVVRGSYRKPIDDDGIKEGTTGMVYKTNMDGQNVAKIRWQNGKKVIYKGEALGSGEIELSPRSRPYHELMPFDPLQFLPNPTPSTSQLSSGDSGRHPPRQEALPASAGQLSTRELQNLSVLDTEGSDSDVTGETEALTIENVARSGLSFLDDMNRRNQILTRREESRNKQKFGAAGNSSYPKASHGQMEIMKSETETALHAVGSYDNTKIRRIRRSNKNSDV